MVSGGGPGGPRLVAHVDRRARTDRARARAFGRPDRRRAPVTPGALLLDRKCGVLRSVCARSVRGDEDAPYRAVRRSLDRVRQAGTCVAVASHNRGDSWEAFNVDELAAMDARIEAALGPVDLWCVCLVDGEGRCGCDLPGPGVLETAARSAGVSVADCAVVAGDRRLQQASARAGATSLLGGAVADPAAALPGDEQGAAELARALDLVAAGHGTHAGPPSGPTTPAPPPP
jgi:D-glycero-D-manno-heptose 1,7-bisphosphate phosphatase